MIFLRILKESVFFAFHALVTNKLRTLLSLLGVTIGIFAIIAVLAAVDSLESNVRNDLSTLGDDVVYVQKWPWGGGGDMPWWKYMNRPETTYRDFENLSRLYSKADAIAMLAVPRSQTVKYKNNSVSDVSIEAVSFSYKEFSSLDVQQGRFFSSAEARNGSNVVVLGAKIAEGLFENEDPIGKKIKAFGRNLKVIGVYKSEGESIIGNSKDQKVNVPLNFLRKIYNLNDGRLGSALMVRASEDVDMTQLKDELREKMRAIRRLGPRDDDNFALNELSVVSSNLDEFFKVLNMAGLFIGGFSILVGGFGIANIMFVSVRERTNIIGIQKSIGAKNYFILTQFLVESVVLALLGGVFGLLMVFGLVTVASELVGMEMFLGVKNIAIGIGVSVSIGLVAGLVPAWMGAKMNPVDAIRTGY